MNSKRRTGARSLLFQLMSMLVILGMMLSVGNLTSPGVAYAAGDQPPTPAPPADSPSADGPAAGDQGVSATLAPAPLLPGGTISDTTPTFKWTRVAGATQYRFYVYKGTSLQYYKTVLTTACGTTATSCSNTPTNVLSYAVFKWRVQAFVGGAWKTPGAFKYFIITNIPTPLSPSGKILDTTPIIIWSSISGATQYRYQLYNWTTLVYTKIVASSFCGTTTCSTPPTGILPYSMAYKWRVQALVGGVWRSYSGWKTFRFPGFNSQFNGSAPGWQAHWGTWSIYNAAYYRSPGLVGPSYIWSSASYTANFANFDYSVRVRRHDDYGMSGNFLIIRGNPGSYSTVSAETFSNLNRWNNTYLFGYQVNGMYGIFKEVNGIQTAILDWTSPYPYIHTGNDALNLLRVRVVGHSFTFYINGNLAYSFSDTSFNSGRVGFTFYNVAGWTGNQFLVDYATLSELP